MYLALLVALGGALGTVLRFILTQLAQRLYGSSMPGTLLVNVVGSLGLGLVMGLLEQGWLASSEPMNAEALSSFFQLGVFGGFTTFSMFVFELAQRRHNNRWLNFSYIALSIGLSMLAVLVGMWLARVLGAGL
ncbi:fluoride efflux transporter FluC [Aliidiomarina quisquiliarum]|uniref:fluoride efflux transporter FluC n=1 Tax=Aliidiomarina quisquiliarum TaxID=2938947 RepID=UPI00208EDA7C|nr:CrcB family protein [Aliidiomarina quisquiliarum]MCO4320786.1 CrcB family protein [Aliidiomarina quisquiliarum]